jgi:hypothetical protein
LCIRHAGANERCGKQRSDRSHRCSSHVSPLLLGSSPPTEWSIRPHHSHHVRALGPSCTGRNPYRRILRRQRRLRPRSGRNHRTANSIPAPPLRHRRAWSPRRNLARCSHLPRRRRRHPRTRRVCRPGRKVATLSRRTPAGTRRSRSMAGLRSFQRSIRPAGTPPRFFSNG